MWKSWPANFAARERVCTAGVSANVLGAGRQTLHRGPAPGSGHLPNHVRIGARHPANQDMRAGTRISARLNSVKIRTAVFRVTVGERVQLRSAIVELAQRARLIARKPLKHARVVRLTFGQAWRLGAYGRVGKKRELSERPGQTCLSRRRIRKANQPKKNRESRKGCSSHAPSPPRR